MEIPLDALESAAGHVDDASCGSGYSTNQTLPHTFKEASCTFLLGSYKTFLSWYLIILFTSLNH